MSCKKCGRDDHVRASTSKCQERILSQKWRFAIKSGDEDVSTFTSTFTIRENFGKFCPDVELREHIKRDVAEVSALAVEALLYVHFHYRYKVVTPQRTVSSRFHVQPFVGFLLPLTGKTTAERTSYTWWRIFTAKTWIVWDGIWRFVLVVSHTIHCRTTWDRYEKLCVRTFVQSGSTVFLRSLRT